MYLVRYNSSSFFLIPLNSLQLGIKCKCFYQNDERPNHGAALLIRSQIRIATIHPGTSKQIEITLRIERFDADHTPEYEAVSYAWGPPEANMSRVILEHQEYNGASRKRPIIRRGWLGVRSNLLSALHQFRLESEPRDMWIDALCIDQQDDIHKGLQVAMMGEIFSRAARVNVWLGPATHDDRRAMEIIHSLGVQVEVDWDAWKITASSQAENSDIVDKSLTLTGEDLNSLNRLFSQEWFDRLWIRQEILLAKQQEAVMCYGSASVRWNIFRRAWKLIDENNTEGGSLATRMLRIEDFLHQKQDADLHVLRDDFKFAKCGGPLDRIYAVRDLFPQQLKKLIYPDYTKSIEKAYQDAVLAYIKCYEVLDFLSGCHYSATWKGPSWGA
ncbi:heterokaryon incompatibility protein-domain-containing protein [Xylariaceae sp. FL0255]|nr:heterokaryon incompatibility protein-domain-containing protein [Xylariaceae sp. FL0255]